MRILVTNDDGIEAEGLCLLEQIILQLAGEDAEIIIYAPKASISGASRSLTFGNNKQVGVEKCGFRRYVVSGTPADCVEVACRIERPIDMIFSGINHGWNLGEGDFYISGTVQAAQHGVHYFGVPAVALSAPQAVIGEEVRKAVVTLLEKILKQGNLKGLINVNLPLDGFKGVKVVKLGRYLAVGELKVVSRTNEATVYDLLGPMVKMEDSRDNVDTDIGAVVRGYTAITLHDGAEFNVEI